MKAYNKSANEGIFRKNVLELLKGAKKEIIVVTGEFYVFEQFQDLRWGIKEAIERGAKVKVIAKSPSTIMINKLLNWGAEVYQTSEIPKEHFVLFDENAVMTTREHEAYTIKGVREGSIYS